MRRNRPRLPKRSAGNRSGPTAEARTGRADGIPLYIEELTKLIVELGGLHDDVDPFAVGDAGRPAAIPSTLTGSLMAQLTGWAGAPSALPSSAP